jgi:hypothetical protein
MSNYMHAFPHFDDALPTLAGFYDSSYKNDACPSITKDLGEETYLQIYIDYKDKAKSDFYDVEEEDYARFQVRLDKPNEWMSSEFLFASNDWAEIEQFIKELNK